MPPDPDPAPEFPARYADVRPLAGDRGGTAWSARDTFLGRDVTLKVAPGAGDPARGPRLRREAETLARLNHPGIVKIFDILTAPTLTLVEEPLEGESLRARLAARGPLAAAEAAAVTRQVLDALRHAHDREVVHRDLNPDVIRITPAGRARLVSFGYARWCRDHAATLGGPVLAQLDYAAPEVVRAEPSGPPADLYSLAVLLCEMVTGRLPYPRGNPLARPPAPEPPAELGPLRGWVAGALLADPAARPDAAALAALLAAPAPATEALRAVAARLDAARRFAHPLKNRLAVARRYPDQPARAVRLIGRPAIRAETAGLARGLLAAVDPADPAAPLGEVAALAATLETGAAPDVASLLAAFEQVRGFVDAGLALARGHRLDLRGWARDWVAARVDPVATLDPGGPAAAEVLVADRDALARDLAEVFETLASNAADAGATALRLTLDADPPGLALAVVDDGRGLPPGDPEALFTAGHTTKAHGSGLGLADARGRIAAAGGRLTAGRAPRGARFTVWLPRAPWETP